MTIGQAKRSLAGAYNRAGKEAVANVLKAGLKAARKDSSGTLSCAQMRKEDHPYARRHGRPLRPAGIINKHRGVFYDAWLAFESTSASGEPSGRLMNDSDVTEFLDKGTKSMFRRPIKDNVEAEMDFAALEAEIEMSNKLEWYFR